MTDRDALIIINLLPGIGPVRVQELLTLFDSPSQLLNLSENEITAVPGIGVKLAHTLASWKENSPYEEEMAFAEKAGVKIVTKLDDEYPPLLLEIYDAPIVLYVRGELPVEHVNTLAVVGSRRFTHYGRKMAQHIVTSAVHAGWMTVSGLAYGIDAAAHKATLEAGGKTIAVLGGGLARIHPQDHIPLAKEIIEKGGAVISEFPMKMSPNKRTFPMRNRVISGLSHGVLVVEAGQRSGSLITAGSALEQGRYVFAVPGQADNPQATGTNSLIRNGAILTESFDDIINEFEFLPAGSMKQAVAVSSSEDKHRHTEDLGDDEKEILKIIEQEWEMTADQLISQTGLPTGQVLSYLMQLEIKKIIVQLPGKRFSMR